MAQNITCLYSRRAIRLLAVLCLIIPLVTRSSSAIAASSPGTTNVILMLKPAATAPSTALAPAGASRVERIQSVINTLQAQASAAQPPVLARLEQMRAAGTVSAVRPFWITNAIAVSVQADQLSALAALPGVASIVPDRPIHPVGTTPSSTGTLAPANLNQIGAPTVWAKGYTGQGVVVANLDTGVSLSAYSLSGKYRGGADSWHDVFGQHTTPYDADGHGTGTMSIMVADNYGVAPGAQWMAVKIFSDAGTAQDSDAIAGLQWVLAPNGHPASAPNVINNSWAEDAATDPSLPCPSDTTTQAMHAALQALVAANILPIFAAGNFGPGTATAPTPSSFPEVIAVGAVDNQNNIASFSSRGPTNCRPAGSAFPDIAAPGVGITFYAQSPTPTNPVLATGSGTSFAAPHVAGALAVLLSAYPGLSAAQQRFLLLHTTTDLGAPGPDNVYGYGALNLLAMYYRPLETHKNYLPLAAGQ